MGDSEICSTLLVSVTRIVVFIFEKYNLPQSYFHRSYMSTVPLNTSTWHNGYCVLYWFTVDKKFNTMSFRVLHFPVQCVFLSCYLLALWLAVHSPARIFRHAPHASTPGGLPQPSPLCLYFPEQRTRRTDTEYVSLSVIRAWG